MNYPWFKFFGSDYLADDKMLGMDSHVRSCWLTLLCYASKNDGTARYLTEDQLMLQAGVPLGGGEWDRTVGVLARFETRKMILTDEEGIHIVNWTKRQAMNQTGAERMSHLRHTRVTHVTLEGEEEKKKNREEKSTARQSYLSEIPSPDLEELREKYDASATQIKRKAEELHNYCLAKGKIYKNYRAFLENALQRDFGRRLQASPVVKAEQIILSADEQARVDALKKEISEKFKTPV